MEPKSGGLREMDWEEHCLAFTRLPSRLKSEITDNVNVAVPLKIVNGYEFQHTKEVRGALRTINPMK